MQLNSVVCGTFCFITRHGVPSRALRAISTILRFMSLPPASGAQLGAGAGGVQVDAMLCSPGSSRRERLLSSASSRFSWILLKCKGCSRVEQPKMADAREPSPPLPSAAARRGTCFCRVAGRHRDLAHPLAFTTRFLFLKWPFLQFSVRPALPAEGVPDSCCLSLLGLL